ncbi:MAG: BrnT family toxin [bacterium]
MNSISFSWDDRKNTSNQKKHNISFEEAQSVFFKEQKTYFGGKNEKRI